MIDDDLVEWVELDWIEFWGSVMTFSLFFASDGTGWDGNICRISVGVIPYYWSSFLGRCFETRQKGRRLLVLLEWIEPSQPIPTQSVSVCCGNFRLSDCCLFLILRVVRKGGVVCLFGGWRMDGWLDGWMTLRLYMHNKLI